MLSEDEFQWENLYGVCNLTYWLDNQFIRYPQPDNSLENCICSLHRLKSNITRTEESVSFFFFFERNAIKLSLNGT